jgi:hypothetical protein
MRLIINIPDSASADEADLKTRATKAFGRCRVEVDRADGQVEAVQITDSEQFATQVRGYLALAKRHDQPLSLAVFRFAVPPDRSEALGQALRDSVAGQCRAEDLLYCDPQGNLTMVLPQTPGAGAAGFCQRMIQMLQCAVRTIGFQHAERLVYCVLVSYDAARHGTAAAMLHEAQTMLEAAMKAQRAGEVVQPG